LKLGRDLLLEMDNVAKTALALRKKAVLTYYRLLAVKPFPPSHPAEIRGMDL